MQLKQPGEQNRLIAKLDSQLDQLPSDVCRSKILPQLLKVCESGSVGAPILGPLFKIGKSLNDDEYKQSVVPAIVKLLNSKDRAVRAKLLQHAELFIKHLSKSVINEQVYPLVVQGN